MKTVERRYQNTLSFLKASVKPPVKVLDIGVDNELARLMRNEGFDVVNTPAVDLDYTPEVVRDYDVDVVTAFEVLEHLVNPFGVLNNLQVPRLIATIPLRLWFAKAYCNPNDVFDQHFHEFEPWQFDRLLEKTGWEIVRRRRWPSRVRALGLRPLLRYFTPRYYAVEAVKKDR